MRHRVLFLVFVANSLFITFFSLFAFTSASAHSGPEVLLVGSYRGRAGQFASVQAAVNAAHSGDWILIGPGDYHEQGSAVAGVLVTTPDIHIRGMNRNRVIVDGTNAKLGARPCSSDPALQNFGPGGVGRNGIEVLKVDGVSVENLTVCNFIGNSPEGYSGNQIWFNGGAGTGKIGLRAFTATYLTTSSSYYKDDQSPQALYGIYAVSAGGPGLIDQTYSSNMGSAAYYIGACPNCNTILTHAHAQNSAAGYSGTNAGGRLIIENSEWDQNKSGLAPASVNNEAWPTPQNGACPNGGRGPLSSHSCTIITNNFVHDNNNPNTPKASFQGESLLPIGAGIQIAGGQNDTIIHNRVMRNGSWGIVIYDIPDPEVPPPNNPDPCRGGAQEGSVCYFTGFGNEVAGNVLKDNGFFGNVTNGDLADGHRMHDPGNCWHGNVNPKGITSTPDHIQITLGTCRVANQGDPLVQAVVSCMITGDPQFCNTVPPLHLPTETAPVLLPIPTQPSMVNPCSGVPSNSWCSRDQAMVCNCGSTPHCDALTIADRRTRETRWSTGCHKYQT